VAVLLFHGNAETVADYDDIVPRFIRQGASLAVVDYRGYGRSTGKPSLRACLTDAPLVVSSIGRWLRRSHPHLAAIPLPLVVLGRSVGSLFAAEVARSVPRIAAGFIFDSATSDLRALVERRGLTAPPRFSAEELATFDPVPKLAEVTAPSIFLHGERDMIVSHAESEALFSASPSTDKRFVRLEGRGHNDLFLDERYWETLDTFFVAVERSADRRSGALVTQALGDALGFLVEGSPPALCSAFASEVFDQELPPERTRGSFSFGQYSDDTQLARELARSLVATPRWSPVDYAKRIGKLFADETIVGRGKATEAAARRLLQGLSWERSGEPAPAAGNGAAMRAAPVGMRFVDPEMRARVADEQARITHADPRARAASVLVADTVAQAIHRGAMRPRGDLFEALASRVEGLDPVLAAGVRRMPTWLHMATDQATAEILRVGQTEGTEGMEVWSGVSPFATPSVLFSLFCWARAPGDAPEVLRFALAAGGDTDTVAAMAGAMVGASVGLEGLEPRLQRWCACLSDQGMARVDELIGLAVALA
jgi:ADP-ribosylglycohydrolase/pimeloyl-ACP methyl ester carboxylesterase